MTGRREWATHWNGNLAMALHGNVVVRAVRVGVGNLAAPFRAPFGNLNAACV